MYYNILFVYILYFYINLNSCFEIVMNLKYIIILCLNYAIIGNTKWVSDKNYLSSYLTHNIGRYNYSKLELVPNGKFWNDYDFRSNIWAEF